MSDKEQKIYPSLASTPYTVNIHPDSQYLHQLMVIGEGEYDIRQVRIDFTPVWDTNTGYSNSYQDVEIQICEPGEKVTLFPTVVDTSKEIIDHEITGQDDAWLVASTSTVAGRECTALELDFSAPLGIYWNDNLTGDFCGWEVGYEVQARNIDNNSDPLEDWITLDRGKFQGGGIRSLLWSKKYEVPLGRYEVRVKRTTPNKTSVDYGDTVKWTALKAYIPTEDTYENVTLLAMKIRASDQLSESLSKKVNVITDKVRSVSHINKKLGEFADDMDIIHEIVHGDHNTQVMTANGIIPTLAKLTKDVEESVIQAILMKDSPFNKALEKRLELSPSKLKTDRS